MELLAQEETDAPMSSVDNYFESVRFRTSPQLGCGALHSELAQASRQEANTPAWVTTQHCLQSPPGVVQCCCQEKTLEGV